MTIIPESMVLNRRHFIASVIMAGVARPALTFAVDSEKMARYLPGRVVSAPELPIPKGKRAPFGWQLATVPAGKQPPLVLAWPDLAAEDRPTHLRFAIGLDEGDEKMMQVALAQSGRVLGNVELRFVSQFQPYQLVLTPDDVAAIRREGVALRLTQGSDLAIFTGGADLPDALRPHLMAPGTSDPMAEYFARMNSLAVIQQFGWMEGCVLDGLLDLGECPQYGYMTEMAKRHLALFIRDGKLIYENPNSSPSDNRVYGIEGGLPFGALARLEPDHPLHEVAVRFWQSRRRDTGSIQDGGSMTSEGAYTVGYALAEIARARRSEELMQLALTQVRVRLAHLFDGKTFYRVYNDNGGRGNRNWARGIAWQILGLTRTLGVARDRDDTGDLIDALRQFAGWVMALQRADGLWSVFANEPALTPDTAGSSGIAAALALGARYGWLGPEARVAAQKALTGLQTHLTADGFLDGVSQSNKGGERVQRSNYRSMFQMGMGLMTQLVAALMFKKDKS